MKKGFYYFRGYYKYDFIYENKAGEKMTLPYEVQNPQDIYLMDLSYEMTEKQLVYEGFEKQ